MSMTEQTLELMAKMRLSGMSEKFQLLLDNPSIAPDSKYTFLASLIQAESDYREQSRLKRNFKQARLRIPNACFEDIDYLAARGLDREVMADLGACDWVDRKQYIILTGSTGTGKTHIACALGTEAIRKGYTVLYKRYNQLLEELELAEAKGEIAKIRARIAKVAVLILDDWAVSPISAKSRLHLLDILEQRAGNGSLIITAQLPVSGWFEYLGDPTIADAILDRVIHRAHRVELRGESMRKSKESL